MTKPAWGWLSAASAGAALWLRPECPVHAATGYLCPGCGATRALAALLHGDLAQAMHLNAMFVAAVLPLLLIYLAVCRWRGAWVPLPPWSVGVLCGVTAAFTIARNLG